MTTIAVTMVKDEADIIGTVLRHMAGQVDGIIVADNMSTDGTHEILRTVQSEIDVPMHIVQDAEVGYTQSAKMTDLATLARLTFGAEWIVPFDADEIWYSPFGRIADILEPIGEQWLVMEATLYDHVATALDDPDQADPVARLGWRRTSPAPLPKVACRWRQDLVIEMGNHGAWYRGGATKHDSQLVIRHFPYRSPEQVVRKVTNGARAYAATDLSPKFGAHWRQWGQILDQSGPEAIHDLFYTWYWRDEPASVLDLAGELQPPLIFDPVAGL